MKSRVIAVFFLVLFSTVLYGADQSDGDYVKSRELMVAKFSGIKPKIFSQWAPGIKKKMETREKIIALTLDACGGKKGNGYDKKLIDYLIENKIPATLFMTGLWIDANTDKAVFLARNSLFDIENHGLRHKPCSVCGFRIYGRKGTLTVSDAYDEIEANARKIKNITGKRPQFYRPGTAYFDDVAIKLTYATGHIPMNFSIVSGDAVKTFPWERLYRRMIKGVKPGSIIIAHMNQADGRFYRAFKEAVPKLKKMGYRFVKLSEYREILK